MFLPIPITKFLYYVGVKKAVLLTSRCLESERSGFIFFLRFIHLFAERARVYEQQRHGEKERERMREERSRLSEAQNPKPLGWYSGP